MCPLFRPFGLKSECIPSSSISADFTVNFDRDQGHTFEVDFGSNLGCSPRRALDFNVGLDTALGPALGINGRTTATPARQSRVLPRLGPRAGGVSEERA
ncbi:hypothetical protein EVAR_21991_1 [Eumeta japonica]|uniref:Uncharacterized protein n=1 Tax=Eumeta variegata TaxID=151549 RepID=A0A4C1VY28_EUMVA|nr:hypothetical protein EVAR_21991_1 [Eumeta japonica]